MITNQKNVFLTEMGFTGYIDLSHPNLRTEFAWMYALNANHININNYNNVTGYDNVFVIIPKGRVFLDACGIDLSNNEKNPTSNLLRVDFVNVLKQNNKMVYIIQEGPSWWLQNYNIEDQINFINLIQSADGLLAHNEYDVKFWSGYIDNVKVIPTLMITNAIDNIIPTPTDKIIIGGNFSRCYGGLSSYVVAQEFNMPIYTMTSHSKQLNEEHLVNHLPRLMWQEWMLAIKDFKYAVHLMATVSAGQFNLNCSYYGIPCIGNEKLDVQRICNPLLSVDADDVFSARKLAKQLTNDVDFYNECSTQSKENYNKYFTIDSWINKMNNQFN